MAVLRPCPLPHAVTQWDRERQLLRREASSGMYSVRAWFTAKTATVTPVQLVQTAVRAAEGRLALFSMGFGLVHYRCTTGWDQKADRCGTIAIIRVLQSMLPI